MITASLSTVSWREPSLVRAVASILPQVDRLNVFLQGYDHVPPCLDHPKAVIEHGGPDSSFGASAKYHWVWDGLVADGYHFAIDDDIEYPPDYVRYCIGKIEDYGRKPIVGFHGAIYKPQMAHYFRDRELWGFNQACDRDRFVHMLGTGTTAFHTSAIRLKRSDFEQPNSCDLYLGIAAQRQHVPMLCLARPKNYLKALPLAADNRSCSAPREYADRMVRIHATLASWEVHPVSQVRPTVERMVVVVVPCFNEPTDRIERTIASALATPGVDLVRVVDDGSDVPVALPARDCLEILRCPNNAGASAALNAGIRSLPDDAIICRLDAGDVFYPEPKSRQIALVKSGAPAVCSWRYDPIADEIRSIAKDWDARIFSECQFVNTATVFTKATWIDVGGFDESLRWCDDWRFCVAVQVHVGWTVFPEVTGEHGEHPGGHSDVSHDRERMKRRLVDRGRVVKICSAYASPDKFAHMFNADWCRKHGVEPLKRPRRK